MGEIEMYQKKFMEQAISMARYSNDPNTHVGCLLVNAKGKKIGLGYNRMPEKALKQFPWGKEGKLFETKYPYVIHAEMAAMKEGLFASKGFLNNELDCYVTLFPCSNCAKLLVEFGVKHIYYTDDKYSHTEDTIASKNLLKGCGIDFEMVEVDK